MDLGSGYCLKQYIDNESEYHMLAHVVLSFVSHAMFSHQSVPVDNPMAKIAVIFVYCVFFIDATSVLGHYVKHLFGVNLSVIILIVLHNDIEASIAYTLFVVAHTIASFAIHIVIQDTPAHQYEFIATWMTYLLVFISADDTFTTEMLLAGAIPCGISCGWHVTLGPQWKDVADIDFVSLKYIIRHPHTLAFIYGCIIGVCLILYRHVYVHVIVIVVTLLLSGIVQFILDRIDAMVRYYNVLAKTLHGTVTPTAD